MLKNIKFQILQTLFLGIFLFYLLISSLGFYAIYKKDMPQKLDFYQTDKSLDFYQLLKDVHELLGKEQIPYAMHGGTLLGAARHKGFIPWDDDLDIMIMEEYEPDILLLRGKLKRLGYQLKRVAFGYKIYKGQLFWFLGEPYTLNNYTSLDIFLMTRENNQVLFNHQTPRKAWPEEYFLTSELYPLKLYTFGLLKVYGPHDATPYLERSFGADWASAAFKIGHGGTYLSKPIKVILSPEAKFPALPFGPLKDRIF